MNDETIRGQGADPASSGNSDHAGGTSDETSGSSTTSDGSGADDRNRRRPKSQAEQRVRWVGIASAVATIVFVLAQIYGTVTGNSEVTKRIQDKIPTSSQIEDLGSAVDELQTSVHEIPPPTETTIIQKGEPGQPGQPGQPGEVKIVRTSPNTVVVTTTSAPQPKVTSKPVKPPTATKSSTPKPQPTCSTSLFGTCIIP